MASFECGDCGDRYPHAMKYQECPVCDVRCVRVKQDPTVTKAEADRRLLNQERKAEFEQWCKENGRRPEEVQATFIELPDLHNAKERNVAMAVCWMLEDRYPFYAVGELHVFWSE
jgi:hypothetical protein